MNVPEDLARRYLLGSAADDERDALERDYYANPATLDQLEAAEERLIEDYLAGSLAASEKERFEREYMSTPDRRRRVEIVRQLIRTAAVDSKVADFKAAVARTADSNAADYRGSARSRRRRAYFALAASLLVAIAGGGWFFTHGTRGQSPGENELATIGAEPRSRETAPAPPGATLQVVALALSPISTRSGAGETPTVTVPRGTDAVRLDLQGDGTDAQLRHPRAVVETVSGAEVWRGDAEPAPDAPAIAARVTIPAPRLSADDYVVILFAADPRSAEGERYRYFFRVHVP